MKRHLAFLWLLYASLATGCSFAFLDEGKDQKSTIKGDEEGAPVADAPQPVGGSYGDELYSLLCVPDPANNNTLSGRSDVLAYGCDLHDRASAQASTLDTLKPQLAKDLGVPESSTISSTSIEAFDASLSKVAVEYQENKNAAVGVHTWTVWVPLSADKNIMIVANFGASGSANKLSRARRNIEDMTPRAVIGDKDDLHFGPLATVTPAAIGLDPALALKFQDFALKNLRSLEIPLLLPMAEVRVGVRFSDVFMNVKGAKPAVELECIRPSDRTVLSYLGQSVLEPNSPVAIVATSAGCASGAILLRIGIQGSSENDMRDLVIGKIEFFANTDVEVAERDQWTVNKQGE